MHELLSDQLREAVLPALGLTLGFLGSQALTMWRRRSERRALLAGDARNAIAIEHHIVEMADAAGAAGPRPAVLRIRSLGQAPLADVVPIRELANELSRRAARVTPLDTLISMEGAEGSYLLEILTSFVCGRAGQGPFERDLFVMAPCCEPAGMANFQPITVLLVRVRDLLAFEDWPATREIQVEHGSDGSRVLTLISLARRFAAEQSRIAQLRAAGERITHLETMYLLDLALDHRAHPIPVRPVPWERFGHVTWMLD